MQKEVENRNISGRSSLPPMPTGPVLKDGISEDTGGILQGIQSASRIEKGIFSLLSGIVGQNVKNLPNFLSKNIIWLGILTFLWFVLWIYPTQYLQSLPKPFSSLGVLLIFLSAAYNGFVAKAFYIGIINSVAIPIIVQVKKEGTANLFAKYKRTVGMIKHAYSSLGNKSLKLFFLYFGGGLFISNILTRNSKIDKYLICLLCAFTLFHALSKGGGDILIRIFSAAAKDILKLFGKKLSIGYNFIFIAFSAFSAGLALAFIPGFFSRNFYDYTAYTMGALFIIAGAVIHFAGGSNANKST